MAGNGLDTVLRNPHLPTLPTVAMQVLERTRSPKINMQEIARVIENDQALAAKVIRTVNSSYYGLSRPCTSIRQAIIYLGLNAVKTLVLGFSLVKCVDGGDDDSIGFDYVDYWQRAIYSAVAAREIAAITGNVDSEEAFLTAMLQDIGMVALYLTYKDLYLQALDMTSGCHTRLVDLERESFMTDHAEVGAAVAANWKMPRQLIEGIRFHHAIDAAPPDMEPLARTLEIAQQGAALAPVGNQQAAHEEFNRLAREHFGCNRQQIQRLIEVISESAEQLAVLFRLDAGDVPEASYLIAEAESQQIQHQAAVLREAELHRRSESEVRKRETFDPVTNLPDAVLFWKKLRQMFDEASRHHHRLAVVVCRLLLAFPGAETTDGSELYVHAFAAVGRLLQRHAGKRCIVYRYDRERFTLIVPDAGRREAVKLAERLRHDCDDELRKNGYVDGDEAVSSTITRFGVAALEPDTRNVITSPELLVACAVRAMQMADKPDDDPVKVFDPSSSRVRAA